MSIIHRGTLKKEEKKTILLFSIHYLFICLCIYLLRYKADKYSDESKGTNKIM